MVFCYSPRYVVSSLLFVYLFLSQLSLALFYLKQASTTLQLYGQPILFYYPFVLLFFYHLNIFSHCKVICCTTLSYTERVFLELATILKKYQFEVHCLARVSVRQLQSHACAGVETKVSTKLLDMSRTSSCARHFVMSEGTITRTNKSFTIQKRNEAIE